MSQPTFLFDTYFYREASEEEMTTFYDEHSRKVYSDVLEIPIRLSDHARAKQRELFARISGRYELRIFIMNGEQIIGWHMGWQENEEQYFMCDTGIFAEHQGKGIYSALLPKLLEIFRDKGFQKVTSRHLVSNNAVLLPKLKAGFTIAGFEIDERLGLFVRLVYIFDEQRLNLYKFRVGAMRPDAEIKKYL